MNLKVERHKYLPLAYEEEEFDSGYRVEIMVENKIIIEIKAVKSLTDVHLAQILTYMNK